MLTASIITKYGITNTWEWVQSADDLFSGTDYDPSLAAENYAYEMCNGQYYDIVYAFNVTYFTDTNIMSGHVNNGHKLNVICQIIVFKNKDYYDKYMADGVMLFDDKEI